MGENSIFPMTIGISRSFEGGNPIFRGERMAVSFREGNWSLEVLEVWKNARIRAALSFGHLSPETSRVPKREGKKTTTGELRVG